MKLRCLFFGHTEGKKCSRCSMTEIEQVCALDCPACGYYCSDKGGVGCILKKSMYEQAVKNDSV